MKVHKILILLAAFNAYSSITFCQTDSLVLRGDLKFSSQYEKIQYLKLLNGDEVYFEALMAINLNANPNNVALDKSMFSNEVGHLKRIPRPSGSGKIKYYKQVYDHVHERFFRKYELSHYFNKVFSDGTYNCVSGSAIYALIFDELEIDYSIKETPTHVYIVLESDGNQYLIETTDPSGRFNKFSKNFKTQFIKQLQSSKLIDDSEVATYSLEDLFNKYYFTDINLSLTQLVGVQYWNDAIYKFQDQDYQGAIDAFKKCYLLYPNEKVEQMLLGSIGLQTSKINYETIEDVALISSLSRFKESDVSDVQLKNEFIRLSNYQLSEKRDIPLYKKSYNYLLETITREELKKEIDFIYNYERARILHNRGKYKLATRFAEKAFGINPMNIDAESLFLSSLSQFLQYNKNRKDSYSMIDSLFQNHELLLENNKFGGLYLNMNLICMADFYKENNKIEGDLYKEKFETLYTEFPNFQVDEDLIGHAYSQMAVYYFRRGQYSSARKVLQKGMSYAPYNHELRTRMRAVND